MVFQKIRDFGAEGCEQLVFCQDLDSDLKAIISLHSTVMGAATGGCRMWKYENEWDALYDVLRLSKGMTYKASLAKLNWGGGKAVILGDPKTEKTKAKLEKFGEFVERLGGKYITAKDVGIGAEDLKVIKTQTEHVLGIDGEEGSSGCPSPATAWGVFHGMKAATQWVFGNPSLKGLTVALQGLGSVSYHLLEHLTAEGVKLFGCDIDSTCVQRIIKKFPSVEIVQPESIYDVKCDLFSPSALGAVINSNTIPRLKAKIIAGAANNQLATPADGEALLRKQITYVPDYAINAGGLINIYYERPSNGSGYSRQNAFQHVQRVGSTISEILERAANEKRPPHEIADRIAEERVSQARNHA